MTLVERIDAALEAHGSMTFNDLARHLYPDPKSWRHQSNGGPPGCFMALSAALNRGRFHQRYDGPGPDHRIVFRRQM